MKLVIEPSKTEQSTKLTFTKRDIELGIINQVESDGYKVDSRTWNETNSKLEVVATKQEKGGK